MSHTRALLGASIHAYGPYGNGSGNKLPTPTHVVLEGIDAETYLGEVTGLSNEIDAVKERNPSGDWKSYRNFRNDIEQLFGDSHFGTSLISRVAMSEISPEWVILDTTTLDQIKHHAGSIVISREVAKVADFLAAWNDALDVD